MDFTDNVVTEEELSRNERSDFQKDIDEIFELVFKDKEYVAKHRLLLTQAIKWKKQSKNPGVLRRGYELEQALGWQRLGKQRRTVQPTQLHDEFIKECVDKSTELQSDVFICYSPTEYDFVNKLNIELEDQGKVTWFEREFIPPDADCEKDIFDAIDKADNFLMVLTPETATSPAFQRELERAQAA